MKTVITALSAFVLASAVLVGAHSSEPAQIRNVSSSVDHKNAAEYYLNQAEQMRLDLEREDRKARRVGLAEVQALATMAEAHATLATIPAP